MSGPAASAGYTTGNAGLTFSPTGTGIYSPSTGTAISQGGGYGNDDEAPDAHILGEIGPKLRMGSEVGMRVIGDPAAARGMMGYLEKALSFMGGAGILEAILGVNLGGCKADGYFVRASNVLNGFGPIGMVESEGSALAKQAIEEHHVFPQEFLEFFKSKGIDIHDYAIPLERTFHQKVIHGGRSIYGKGGEWNAIWREWINSNRGAGPEQIMQQMEAMRKQFNIDMYAFKRYKWAHYAEARARLKLIIR